MSLLLDASVWVAAAVPEERFHRQSESLVESPRRVATLEFALLEVANSLGVRLGRRKRASWLVEAMLSRCENRLLPVDPPLIAATLEIAAEHGITAYDAAYVAAAERHGMTLVSGDLRDLVSKGLAITPDAAV